MIPSGGTILSIGVTHNVPCLRGIAKCTRRPLSTLLVGILTRWQKRVTRRPSRSNHVGGELANGLGERVGVGSRPSSRRRGTRRGRGSCATVRTRDSLCVRSVHCASVGLVIRIDPGGNSHAPREKITAETRGSRRRSTSRRIWK